MGRTALYGPWVRENLFPMGHGPYGALENYKFPMAHGPHDPLANYNFCMGHGSYSALENYNFPIGHGSYSTIRSMGHAEFISHGAWIVRCSGKL